MVSKGYVDHFPVSKTNDNTFVDDQIEVQLCGEGERKSNNKARYGLVFCNIQYLEYT